MATKPLTFRLEPKLAAIVDEQAQNAGRDRAAHLAAIVEAHLRHHGEPAPSDEFLKCHDEILRLLRTLSENTETRLSGVSTELQILNQILANKEREANREFTRLRMQIDQVRSDIATLFGAALQSFAGVERDDAIAFTQKYMYPANGRA